MRGVEPPRLAALDPKSSVSANSTTSAKNRVVHPPGFEPGTARLEGECSIQLSYECLKESRYNTIC